jgi:hypothetical protein
MTKKTTAAKATKATPATTADADADDAQRPVKAAKPAKAAAAPPQPPVDEPAADGDAEAAAPMNRAERRAKGRGKTVSTVPARGKVTGGHGPAHTQRMWANRRSG